MRVELRRGGRVDLLRVVHLQHQLVGEPVAEEVHADARRRSASIMPCWPPMQRADGHEQGGDRRHQDGGLQQVEHRDVLGFGRRRRPIGQRIDARAARAEFKSATPRPGRAPASKRRRPAAAGRCRNAAAGRRRPPARCSSVSASAPSPQATTMPRRSAPSTSPGAPLPGRHDSPRQHLIVSPPSALRAPGNGIEGAQAALDRRRRLAPVDRRLGLVDLVRRRSRRRRAAAGACSRRGQRAASACDDQRGRRARPGGRAAWRWCRRRDRRAARASSISPVSRPASICMMVMPVSASPASIARWIGAAPRQRGSSEAWMLRQPQRAAGPAPIAAGSGRRRRRPSRRAAAATQRVARRGGVVGELAVEPQAARLRDRRCRARARTLLDRRRPAASCRGRPAGRAGSAPAATSKPARMQARQRDARELRRAGEGDVARGLARRCAALRPRASSRAFFSILVLMRSRLSGLR